MDSNATNDEQCTGIKGFNQSKLSKYNFYCLSSVVLKFTFFFYYW